MIPSGPSSRLRWADMRSSAPFPPVVIRSASSSSCKCVIVSGRPWCDNNCAEKRMSVPQEIFMPRRCANSQACNLSSVTYRPFTIASGVWRTDPQPRTRSLRPPAPGPPQWIRQ